MKNKTLHYPFLMLCALLFALFGNMKQANAYDFFLPLGNNEVYFTITDQPNHYVEYVCPNESNFSWDGYTKPSGILDLPGTFEYNGTTYTATSIGHGAFYGCSAIYAVTIPSTVTSMESDAFQGTSLAQVNINSNAIASHTYTSIYNFQRLFGGNVDNYTFGEGVTAIGPCALDGCDFMSSVTLPNTLTTIGYSAFEGCSALESVVLPNSLTTIGNAAFRNCTQLTSVTIPASLTSIQDMAFDGCYNLNAVYISSIAAWCGIQFENNSVLPSNPLIYAHHLYDSNSGSEITNLVIPSWVTSINSYAFYGLTGIQSVTFPLDRCWSI